MSAGLTDCSMSSAVPTKQVGSTNAYIEKLPLQGADCADDRPDAHCLKPWPSLSRVSTTCGNPVLNSRHRPGPGIQAFGDRTDDARKLSTLS